MSNQLNQTIVDLSDNKASEAASTSTSNTIATVQDDHDMMSRGRDALSASTHSSANEVVSTQVRGLWIPNESQTMEFLSMKVKEFGE